MNAEKKWALITGASGGIGRAIAAALAADGYSLYLHYHKNKTAAEALRTTLTARHPGQTFHAVPADLSRSDGVDRLLSHLDHGVYALVHNSGTSHIGLVQDVPRATVQDFLQLHLASPFLLTQRLLPEMIRRRSGKIIFITSIWGVTGAATEALYSMVKGGQNGFVKALAKEVAPSGIAVNAVAPGAIDTPMLSDLDGESLEILKQEIPAGRLGRPEEVAALVRFLASPESDYINGQIISINGAWHC